MTNDTLTLTSQDRTNLEVLTKDFPIAVKFGSLQAKRYVGKNPLINELNVIKAMTKEKYIGQLQMIMEGNNSIWYLFSITGNTFRIPEPIDGIEELFDIEFKRKRKS